jgi:hypothetical protein
MTEEMKRTWEEAEEKDAEKDNCTVVRRNVRRVESLPRLHLEKISLSVFIRKEAAKVWAEDVSDDVAIRKTRIKAWASDLWNDLVRLVTSVVKHAT